MNEEDRRAFAEMTRAQRLRLFSNKSSAYKAAGVNPTTYERVENGLSVKDETINKIVRTFWPDAGGDWRNVLSGISVGSEAEDSFVAAPGSTTKSGVTNEQVLAEVRAMRQELGDVQRRLAVVEQQGSKSLGRSRGPG